MLWETLERVNRLRQEALNDPEFIRSAKAHEKALESQEVHYIGTSKRSAKSKKTKALSDIYQQSEFGYDPSGSHH
ncbi:MULTISPECIES: hypothetical protein [Vibrio]|jgi:hypothetical protein|uniref:hypothetical protein n=1 Tax=Vibrio TaxID=662 RepID=UPI0001B945CD|nr:MULTISPECIES: hypothetical protein [Vibrio]AXN30187.1 hypothetical protein DVV14_02285 [Vibrio coralliilyticus]EEX33519.1 hypothetical protein VIC_001415 [Vibrio coralliilyticus ATCC BAA-450]ERB62727.1 hypothetical protein N779_24575 [Vibrio coralliilyticus OCN008]KPH25319.1 hypothetical protein ADU60_08610 [Vibrio coralliilyticus]MCM5509608.1 hypothetical protein [Vibrio sp. SCSIO 43169]